MKGNEIPDWPYWCFLPESCWLILFMGKRRKPFTREIYQDIQILRVLGTWRYSKGIYSVHPTQLDALTKTPVSDSLPVDVFLRLPEWCIYIRTPGMIMAGERLYGFWATVNQGMADNKKRLCLLLNSQSGIDIAGVSSINGRQVRAHLRRGQWHGFWSGKRDGLEDRIFSYRWLPPQVIGGRQRKGVASGY